MTDFRPGRFRVLPTVVKNLIIINTIIVFAQYVLGKMGIDMADWFGLHYWGSHYFHWWQIVTHMFMHGSYNDVNMTILHLFSNMFALWMFGSILENVWGPKRFFTFYMICGIGAALCHLSVIGYQFHSLEKVFSAYQANPTFDQYQAVLQKHFIPLDPDKLGIRLAQLYEEWKLNPTSLQYANDSKIFLHEYLHGIYDPANHVFYKGIFDEATVGASGAVFGVLFAFGYLFPNTLLYFYFLVPIKAKWVVAGYALFELYSGIQNSAGDNIAHYAHLGGMLFAFILLKIWNKRNRNDFF
jgi:membrane associated rhomboid family serine protease